MRESHDMQNEEADLDDVRVVAVDSRQERRQVIRRLLEHCFEPAEIAEADSREAAVERVGQCRPEVVVSESAMPVEEGLDTLTVQAALDRGADAYVPKPGQTAELRAALGVPPAARAIRHRPPNERPISPSPRRSLGQAIGTGAGT